MIEIAYTNIQSKIKTSDILTVSPLSEDFVRVVHSRCCCALLRLRYLQILLMPIQELKVRDHEIKTVDSTDDNTIFTGF